MADFDPKAFLGSTSPTAPPAGPAQAAEPPTGFDPQRFINGGRATDQLMGEQVPLPLSGNTPETASSQGSPLSMTDRMKMSFGNEKGNVDFLKQRFADAKPILDDKGKPTKDLAVRDGNTWFRVNPKNGDIPDPWERTKEYLKDAATYAPEALGVGVAAATDIATSGASIPESAAIAGGTAAAVRTSLGRIVGTYQATPAEQAWDIGFESILNAAGAKVIAGVKPTAKFVAGKLDAVAEAFKDTVEPYVPTAAKSAAAGVADFVSGTPKAVFKKIMATYSVGERSFDTMMENTPRTKAAMHELDSLSSGDTAAYHDLGTNKQLSNIQNIADKTRVGLSQIYGQMRNKLLADVPSDFSVNLDDAVYAATFKAMQNGVGVLQAGGRELEGQAAIDYIAKSGLKNTGFRMYSQDELAKRIGQGADIDKGIGYLATDKEAHGIMSEFYDNLSKFVGGQNRTGVEGARSLLDFKKVAADLSNKMASTETARSTPQVKGLIDEAKVAVDSAVHSAFKVQDLGQEFLNLNSTYSTLSDKFQPLLNAKRLADNSGSTKPYMSLLNEFLARPGKNPAATFAIDDAIKAADAHGLKALSQNLLESKTNIQILQAAKDFNPLSPSSTKAAAINASQVLAGSYLMTHPDPLYIAAAIGVKAVTSPMGAGMAIATTQGLAKGQQMLSNMTKGQVDKFLSSPEAIKAFTTAVVQAPIVRAQAQQQMQSLMQQQVAPAPPQRGQ